MGEREISSFEKEVKRIVKELLNMKGEQLGETFSLKIKQQVIREMRVEQASLVFEGLKPAERELLAGEDFEFDKLRSSVRTIKVEGKLSQKDIQNFLSRELAQQKPERLIFHKVDISFTTGKVKAEGLVDLRKIPGNILAFLPQNLSPFSATFVVEKEGSKLMIDILEAQVNQQPMTPELRTQVLNWLNPLWDFSNLPYNADLEELNFAPDGVSFKGYLFSR